MNPCGLSRSPAGPSMTGTARVQVHGVLVRRLSSRRARPSHTGDEPGEPLSLIRQVRMSLIRINTGLLPAGGVALFLCAGSGPFALWCMGSLCAACLHTVRAPAQRTARRAAVPYPADRMSWVRRNRPGVWCFLRTEPAVHWCMGFLCGFRCEDAPGPGPQPLRSECTAFFRPADSPGMDGRARPEPTRGTPRSPAARGLPLPVRRAALRPAALGTAAAPLDRRAPGRATAGAAWLSQPSGAPRGKPRSCRRPGPLLPRLRCSPGGSAPRANRGACHLAPWLRSSGRLPAARPPRAFARPA